MWSEYATMVAARNAGRQQEGIVEYFTEDELDRVWRDFRADGEIRGVRVERLVEHARELLRLKAEDGPAKMCNPVARLGLIGPGPGMVPIGGQYGAGIQRAAPADPKPRESRIQVVWSDEAIMAEDFQRQDGFEIVSCEVAPLPTVIPLGKILCLRFMIHFRKP